MKFNALFMLIFLGVIFQVVRKPFEFEKLTKFTNVFIPFYSIIMFITTMVWNLTNIVILLFLLMLSVFIALFQASKVQIKKMPGKGNNNQMLVYVRKGYPYLLGWVIIFLTGIGCSLFFESVTKEFIFRELFSEIKSEFLVYSIFSQQKNWYVWLMSGVTSFLYIKILEFKNPDIKSALHNNKKTHS
ncbi:hypothetical protein JCM15457_1700 [Liquorilactobacillus sucicola DSM 21376 = JCM 15457]|uniref:Hydrophobic protein n=1 Tax=Liquorilactobacillus sucicola DSM 21376 = JCM 15457 TaxID=1423806 RepID=A0A023CZ38_9LACO|nr:hypothetical protein [Liquorilactobacillus sucicola]KRN07611.1 hypothetical protein FD15_GL000901 [Liquorilactobacillus sucicola DSM 21376 = JCM 15457]GAJ26755.1 hypothetical protein JCM15457_1700 [Liquorilactobacillus sucicola DSM 21376 = JCM 15457]